MPITREQLLTEGQDFLSDEAGPASILPSQDLAHREKMLDYVDEQISSLGSEGLSLQDVAAFGNTYEFGNFRTTVGTGNIITEQTNTGAKVEMQPTRIVYTREASGTKILYLQAPTQQTASSRTQTFQDKTGRIGIQEYKQFVCKLTQAGTSDPVKTVIGNNDIGNISFARTGVGVYTGNLEGAFTANTFLPRINQHSVYGYRAEIKVLDVDNIQVTTYDGSGMLADDILLDAMVEVRVYNV